MGRLDQALQWISNPMLYIRPAIRREAVSTSALEGTFAAFEDVMGAEIAESTTPDASLSEVLNFVQAAEAAFETVHDRPVKRALLCDLQRILVRGTASDGSEAGQIRQTAVVIGPKGGSVEQARFIPPPPGDSLEWGLRDWEDWSAKSDDDLPILVRVAISHYQFETLHPFTDGNGRIGRLVTLLQLVRAGVLTYPMLNLSTWLYARRDDYVDHLLAVSRSGDFDPWIQFFCQAIEDEATAAVTRIRLAQDWQAALNARIKGRRVRSPTVHALANDMIGHPVLTPTWVQHHHSVSYPTANTAIAKLVELGAVREVTGRAYGRTFVATELLAIFS
jgi:Fic family protein